MSRIRSVHPGLWTDERFVSVGPLARLFFMGIWNECDDAGSFEWSPLKLKMRLLPADNVDAAEMLEELAGAGMVLAYEIDGRKLGAVRNFTLYQRPKKPNSIYPQTPEVRNFCGLKGGAVPNQLPTGGEIPPQMEDGGGKREEEEREEVTAPGGASPFAFEGRVIRLKRRDFDNWRKAYPDIDLPASLQSRDDWLAMEADDATRKKWFLSTSNHLANLQQRAKAAAKQDDKAWGMPC